MPATVEVSAFNAGLRAWGERAHAATEQGVQKAGSELKAVIQDNLARSHYPPASEPGTPPAYRSGFLHDNVYQRTRELSGGFQERVYPSTVYARIHELSGWAGAGHRSFLPKRPYVGPALEEYTPQFRGVMVKAWRGALPGG
jgi:hypothetical protein